MKFMIFLIGLLTVLGGLLPLLVSQGLLPDSVPTSGLLYQGIIVLLGVIGIFYGVRNK